MEVHDGGVVLDVVGDDEFVALGGVAGFLLDFGVVLEEFGGGVPVDVVFGCPFCGGVEGFDDGVELVGGAFFCFRVVVLGFFLGFVVF